MEASTPQRPGFRITDGIVYFRQMGELPRAVSLVRERPPERFRWCHAVVGVMAAAQRLHVRERARIEEPVREVVIDLYDTELRSEIVVDVRGYGCNFDRGELLPPRTEGDLRRLAFLEGADLELVDRHLQPLHDFDAHIDTALVALRSRALSNAFFRKSEGLAIKLESTPAGSDFAHYTASKADNMQKQAQSFRALARALTDVRH